MNLAVAAFSFVFILGALEILLAITNYCTPANTRFIPQKGLTYIPHAYYRNVKEGFSEGYFNAHGFRDYERTYEKPPGVFRILVLGDSYKEALQVQLTDSFTALLENSLNAQASSTRFEVLALGQSSFGTADEFGRYLNFGVEYHPDLVVLAFLTGNDFRDNSKLLNRERFGFYYGFDENQHLVLDRSLVDAYLKSLTYPKRLFQSLKTKSRLLNLMAERAVLFKLQFVEMRMAKAHGIDERVKNDNGNVLDLFSDLNIYRKDLPPPWREAIEITKGIIVNMKRAVEGNGSRFLLIVLSNSEQVHPEVSGKLTDEYKIDLDYEQPDRILEEFAREQEIVFLELMPAFLDYHVRTGEFLHYGFESSYRGHWNQAGHRLAAELTYRSLKERHLVPLESEDS